MIQKRERHAVDVDGRDSERRMQVSLRRKMKRNPNIQDDSSSKRRRRKNKDKTSFSLRMRRTPSSATSQRGCGSIRAKRMKEKSLRHKKRSGGYGIDLNDVQKRIYGTFLNEVFSLGVDGLMQQYKTYLKTFMPQDITHVAFDRNMDKNRYKDVTCMDKTRVILHTPNDYIHANYVNGPPLTNTFICTQEFTFVVYVAFKGPMENTADDFWEMVVQENVAYIFMLCNTMEGKREKCFQYWPFEEGCSLEFGGIRIKNTGNHSIEDPTFTTADLSVTKNNTRLVLRHFLWRDWPDRGVPKNDLAPFQLLALSRKATTRPTIVHCSAGIGRTGSIVAIEMSLQQIISAHPLDIIHTIQQLRCTLSFVDVASDEQSIGMRMNCVQTEQQLVYVVKCLTSFAVVCDVFSGHPDLMKKCLIFETEYEKMLLLEESSRREKRSKGRMEALKRIMSKRRSEMARRNARTPKTVTTQSTETTATTTTTADTTTSQSLTIPKCDEEEKDDHQPPNDAITSSRRHKRRKPIDRASTNHKNNYKDEQRTTKSEYMLLPSISNGPYSTYN